MILFCINKINILRNKYMKKQEIKVLHLITELAMGGAQDNTILTVKGLKEKGYIVDIASAPGGYWEEIAKQNCNNLIHIKGFSSNKISLKDNIRAIIEVYNLLKANKYDIVHTHSSTAGFCGRIAAKIAGIPVIIHTVHGFPFHNFMNPLKRNFLIFTEWLSAKCCDHMITVSNLNLEEITARKIDKRSNLTNIYSGIDFNKFNVDKSKEEIKQELGIDKSILTVGMVARLSEQKAPMYFIEAAKQVLREQDNVMFLIAGDGPLRKKLETLIGSEEKIKLLGSKENIPEILKILDVFALSSIYEGLGRALTEAMAMGIPPIAPAVNGIPEIIKDGNTGFLVEPKSSKQLAEKIKLLLNNEKLRSEISKNTVKEVIPKFSHQLMIDEIENLYIKILKDKLNIVLN